MYGRSQADHGQIMGGKQDCSKLCPNCIKSLYNHQRRSRPWNTTKTQDLNLIFFNKSVIFGKTCAARAAPAPGLPRAGAGRPRDARIEKFLQVQNFFRIFTVAACKYTGDHRQIMGRSWATSRPYRNQVSKKKFAKNFSRKAVSRANFVIILILHVKLSKRYPIVRKKRTIFYIALL